MADEKKKAKKGKSWTRLISRAKGRGNRKCRFCGCANGLIRRYGLNMCRRCFREVGEDIGFRTY